MKKVDEVFYSAIPAPYLCGSRCVSSASLRSRSNRFRRRCSRRRTGSKDLSSLTRSRSIFFQHARHCSVECDAERFVDRNQTNKTFVVDDHS